MTGELVHVTWLDQAETMRVIRNSCRQFMTGNQQEITPEQQIEWFQTIDLGLVLPFLYQPRRQDAMGYGLIRKEADRWWVSGGLLPEWRGKGIGKDLFWELTDYVHQSTKEPSWLKVFESNAVAVRLYRSLGYAIESVALDGHSAVLTMCMGLS